MNKGGASASIDFGDAPTYNASSNPNKGGPRYNLNDTMPVGGLK